MDHMVEHQAIGWLVWVAKSGRQCDMRLLLAGSDNDVAIEQHHEVMEVDLVDRRRGAVGELEIRPEANDPARFAGALVGLDVFVKVEVLPRLDRERHLVGLRDRARRERRLDDLRKRWHGLSARGARYCGRNCGHQHGKN